MVVDEETGRFVRVDVHERFWAKVDRRGPRDCWEWTGARLLRPGANYGRFWTGEREVKAHRFSYELFIGPIPEGLFVCHRCDNPPCVNPAHLWVGTHDDNMADKKAKGRNCYGPANGSRTHPERRPRGEGSPVAVLSDAAALAFFEAYCSGDGGQAKLAQSFGISRGTASNILLGKGRFKWLR